MQWLFIVDGFINFLNVVGTLPRFSAILLKGNNFRAFMLASLEEESISKGSTLNRKNLLLWEQILFFELNPYREECKTENQRADTSESISCHRNKAMVSTGIQVSLKYNPDW